MVKYYLLVSVCWRLDAPKCRILLAADVLAFAWLDYLIDGGEKVTSAEKMTGPSLRGPRRGSGEGPAPRLITPPDSPKNKKALFHPDLGANSDLTRLNDKIHHRPVTAPIIGQIRAQIAIGERRAVYGTQ